MWFSSSLHDSNSMPAGSFEVLVGVSELGFNFSSNKVKKKKLICFKIFHVKSTFFCLKKIVLKVKKELFFDNKKNRHFIFAHVY